RMDRRPAARRGACSATRHGVVAVPARLRGIEAVAAGDLAVGLGERTRGATYSRAGVGGLLLERPPLIQRSDHAVGHEAQRARLDVALPVGGLPTADEIEVIPLPFDDVLVEADGERGRHSLGYPERTAVKEARKSSLLYD